MTLMLVSEAAAQAGVSVEDIEAWAAQGLLQIHLNALQRWVDKEEFESVVENLGWMQISAESWDRVEGD